MRAEGASQVERTAAARTPVRHTVLSLLGLAAVVLIGVAVGAGPASASSALRIDDPLPNGWVNTPTGPLSPADRELLVRVRLAGLWEAPAGQMAQDHSNNDKVKDVGHHLQTDHVALDQQVRTVAAKLGVELPNEPSPEQQGWLNELSAAQGLQFDQIFADRLRAAHGKVFSIVAAVRAATRNDTIRAFAQTGITVVMKHMTLLESIGLVNYEALPTAVVPQALAPAASVSTPTSAGINPNLVWLVLGIALVAGLITAVRVIRPR